jgi:hypothetical protein
MLAAQRRHEALFGKARKEKERAQEKDKDRDRDRGCVA